MNKSTHIHTNEKLRGMNMGIMAECYAMNKSLIINIIQNITR